MDDIANHCNIRLSVQSEICKAEVSFQAGRLGLASKACYAQALGLRWHHKKNNKERMLYLVTDLIYFSFFTLIFQFCIICYIIN